MTPLGRFKYQEDDLICLGRVSRHLCDRRILRLPRNGEPDSESDKKKITQCLTMLDNASGSGAHHCNLGKIAAETRRETDLALCRLTIVVHISNVTSPAADKRAVCRPVWVPQRQAAKSGLLRVRLLMPPLCTQFRMSTFSPWTNSGRSALRCLSADSRPVRDRATLHVSCLICGVRRAGWYLPSCARRRLAHCCGPGSLKLLPCRGNPFVDLVVTLLQILAGAKRKWRHRPLDYSYRGGLVRGEGGAESLAVSDVIYSDTAIEHSTADASRHRDRQKGWHDTRVRTRSTLVQHRPSQS